MKEIKRLTRCANGHFYNGEKYDACPHCSNTKTPDETVYLGEKTFPGDNKSIKAVKKEEKPVEAAEIIKEITGTSELYEELGEDIFGEKEENEEELSPDEKSMYDFVSDMMANGAENQTVHYYEKSIGAEPVVGWLVCVKGVHFGEDFKIKSGRNFIGRSGSMNISLSGDKTVSRDRHAILTYDPKSNSFMIQPGESSEQLCYLNNELALIPTKLKANDRISLGETELIFIPFCSEAFNWENEI